MNGITFYRRRKMLEERVQQAKDYAAAQAVKANAVADAKADSWVTSAAKWLVASRFTWAILGAAGGVFLAAVYF
jgi:hypothetical protein